MIRRRMGLAWLLASVALTAGTAHAGLDRSIERMMGRDARAAIESQYRLVQTPALAGFVDRVGQRVAAASPRKLTYTFRIIETDEVNAMALPSGDVYVTTGLLDFVKSQDELAGVLGHELAHVAEKHSLNAFKQQFWTGLALSAVPMSSGLAGATNLATTLYFLRYSRKDEAAADRVGARITLDAGYDSFALEGFMARLGQQHKEKLSTVEGWFTTHPEAERRVSRLAELKELDPSRQATVLAVGNGYLDRHFAAEAVLRMRRAAALAPNDAQAQLRLAQAEAAAGLKEESAGHAARAMALDPRLAEQAREIRLAAAGDQAATEPAPPVPPDLDQRLGQSLQQVQTSREQATASAKGLSAKLEAMAKTRKDLADRTQQLGRDLTGATSSGRVTGERASMLRRVAAVLDQIEQVAGRLGAVARTGSEDAQQADATGSLLAQELESASSPATKSRWLEWAGRYVSDVGERRADSETITAEAEKAMASAGAAAQHASDVMDALYHQGSLGWSSGLALDSARTSLETAEKEAKQASDAARRASALQSEATVRQAAWQLDMTTLTQSPAERAQADGIVAGYLGADVQAVREARREAGGLGSGALKLIAAMPPAKEQPKAQTPAKNAAPADEPKASKPEQQPGVDLLISLLKKDLDREIAAAKRVAEDPQAQEPLPPKPPEPLAKPT